MSVEHYGGEVIAAFARSVFRGVENLESVPGLLKRIVKEDLWREYPSGGETVRFSSFDTFLEKGVNVEVRALQLLCRDDPEALDLLDRMLAGKHGNAEVRALRRLRNDRPELHQKVIKRELSSHAAMVEAGFRQKRITVPRNPERVAKLIRRHFTAEEVQSIIEGLSGSD